MNVMKKVLTLIMLFVPLLGIAQQKSSEKPQKESWVIVDKDSVKLFYGMTAPRIINLPTEEAKGFVKKYDIAISDFVSTVLEAKNHLSRMKIKKDSIQLIRIYDRIEKKLGIKKSNGDNSSKGNS